MLVELTAALLLASAPLNTLRANRDHAVAEAVSARADADAKAASRVAAERELESLKSDLAAGKGGWLGESRVRRKSAAVRELVEVEAKARTAADAAEAAAAAAGEALREALFADASDETAQGDSAAKEGRRADAQVAYASAARDLRDASGIPGAQPAADPWKGMDAEIPLEGASRQSVAASYRAVADDIARQLPALETQARALDEAAKTYARLSEFRGVLERGGTPVVDPTPERDRLGAICRRGRELVDELRRRAADVESASARGAQPEGTP